MPAPSGPGAAKVIEQLLKEAVGWPETAGVGETKKRIRAEAEKAEEELATLVLRRIVPGRCKYCPF